jgi:hypothetical protein
MGLINPSVSLALVDGCACLNNSVISCLFLCFGIFWLKIVRRSRPPIFEETVVNKVN